MAEQLSVAIVGYGLAVAPVERALMRHGGFRITACVDTSESARVQFLAKHGGSAFESVEQMLSDSVPDVVYIATPTKTHKDMSIRSLEAGANVLVEKPIALGVDEAVDMIGRAKSLGRVLMVNHKRSADREILTMRALIARGDSGAPQWTSRLHFSDWIYRWRAAEERDPAFGGVVSRQGSHEFDVLRGLLPSAPVRLRGWVGDLDDDLPAEGAYSCWIECADGSMASSVYSGYDRFRTDEFTAGLLPSGLIGASERLYRENIRNGVDEYHLKSTIGHPRADGLQSDLYGFTFAMCRNGDLRAAPGGSAWLYDRTGRQRFTIEGPAGTALIVAELFEGIRNGTPTAHDGSWGLACLELCVAVRDSADSGSAVDLKYQSLTTDQFLSDSQPLLQLSD